MATSPMTKFEEMWQAHAQCVQAWNEYRNRSYGNLMTLYQGFNKHCQIPPDCITPAPLDKEVEPGRMYGPAGAIHFDTKEGYWCLGFILNLEGSRLLLEIDLREQAGKILVKRGPGDKPKEIDIALNPKQCGEFYDSIADRVKQFYAVGPDSLPDDTRVRRIGFAVDAS